MTWWDSRDCRVCCACGLEALVRASFRIAGDPTKIEWPRYPQSDLEAGIRQEPGQRFGFHNFRHSLATFLVSRAKDVKTIQELLRHAKVTTTLDLYSQAIDAAKLEAQE
jgi:integrase